MYINLFWFISLSEGHGAAESAPMVIEATLFAKSLSNGNNGSGWSIKWLAYPEYALSLSFFHVPGCEVCRNHDRRAFTLLTAQNYCNFSKLPTFYLLICIVFIPKASFTPPRSWSVSISKSCLFASLVMVITRFWWWKLPPSCRLILVSSALFCPLLSYSLSSVSLRDFFGVAHLITVAGQATSFFRMNHFSLFHAIVFWLFALVFLFNMLFCENEPLKSWWSLDFDVALS